MTPVHVSTAEARGAENFLLAAVRYHAKTNPSGAAFELPRADGREDCESVPWIKFAADLELLQRSLRDLLPACPARVGILGAPSYALMLIEIALMDFGSCVEILDSRLLRSMDLPPLLFINSDEQRQLPAESSGQAQNAIEYSLLPTGAVSLVAPPTRILSRALNRRDGDEVSGIATFTSGSDDSPKRLSFSTEQVETAVTAFLDAFDGMRRASKSISWLPLTALYQRMINYSGIIAGVCTHILAAPNDIYRALPSVAPDYIFGVPSFYLELQKRAASITGGAEAIKARLLGTKLAFAVTGSAKTPIGTLDFFERLGVPLLEAYGVSECIIPVAANSLHVRRHGSVGKPLKAHHVAIDGEGRIMIRSSGIARECALNRLGMLETGDIGEIDRDGFITLLGRDGEIIKTTSGRRFSAAGLELRYDALPFVAKALVISQDERALFGVLYIPDLGRIGLEQVCAEIARAHAHAPRYEQVCTWGVFERAPSEVCGEVTRTGKLRRRLLADRYAPFLSKKTAERMRLRSASSNHGGCVELWEMS